jgi:release factor glutamine methyltransferase
MQTQTEIIPCNVLGKQVLLGVSPLLFRPTLTTTVLTGQLANETIRNRVVLDLGCGVGPIAIGLAMAGAEHVYAIDIMPEACEIAVANARLNRVDDKLSFLQGDTFEPVRGRKFDIIVDDISAVAEEVARLSSWFPLNVSSGGEDGTINTVKVLRQSQAHLNPRGFLLFPVLSLSRHKRILDVAREVFGDRLTLVASKRIPFSAQLKRNMRKLEELRSRGLIEFAHARSRPYWSLEIYKAYALQSPSD